jgi:predicted phosphodiesterase
MLILVISDIHANLTALETILHEAGNFDAAWCLGDLVGYGPDPNECIELIQTLPNLVCVMGNHDCAVIEHIKSASFNPEARLAIQWTRNELSKENHDFLKKLPEKIVIKGVTIVHGSPRHPIWEYLLDAQTASISFDYFDTSFCFIGHTHLPVIYSQDQKGDKAIATRIPQPNHVITLPIRSMINPGSVGQPRDRDTRSSFAIFDTENKRWHYRRIPYDISSVQERMYKAHLSERHINRLSSGW